MKELEQKIEQGRLLPVSGVSREYDDPDLPSRPRKRTFIFLLLVTCLVLVGLAFLLWWVPYVGLGNIHPSLPVILGIAFGCLVLFGLGGALTLVLTIVRGKNLFFNRRIRGVVIRVLFPLLVGVGRCFGISKDEIRRSFVAINNKLVLAEAKKVRPEEILILLPHCLQHHDCTVRITGNVENCKECGKCRIKDLVELSRKYHVPAAVATGGTLARRIVVEKRPKVIVGVACERDLTSGIQDSYPIPVFGVFNKRPFGPCYDTDVTLELVEKGIKIFLD
ncbi:MAG: DUF116 domain-containing protein [Deltaproteobacteria bacterium]|nr:DUF116 domain-containing protein [Deltaproteobacteria bacterium]MBW2110722.1 DUF116 domain-containing protein [Deltaproteobacteria bacterium]MBW2353530.1 DUF116 domain-containing protein [Deltaproteobacteria bacterium]